MEPMKPMKPMEPMKPMSGGEKWWPDELGQPSSSGSQNSMRYAFFPKARRLLIEKQGNLTTYDSGDHQISGMQQSGETRPCGRIPENIGQGIPESLFR
jgi:hypothetical protein